MNFFSLFFVIGQTSFLLASNTKKCRVLYWILYSRKIHRKVKYSDLYPAEKLGALLFNAINRI